MIIDTRRSRYAKAAFTIRARWTHGFLCQRRETTANAAIPHILDIFDDKHSFFHAVENFRIAAGQTEGEFRGTPFGDGDFYKLLEGMAYSPAAREQLDAYAALIAQAQQPDGYLSTKQIIGERSGNGVVRHGDVNDFEEYNFGHLFTAACAHARLTGSTRLLKVAEGAAAYLERLYQRVLQGNAAQTAVCPSHYMGLADLYRTTGDERYLRLLQTAIDLRDRVQNGTEDNQDKLPLREQRVMRGHAVRATYLYAGVSDLYLENGDETLLPTLRACWRNLLDTKLYITGGLGALYTGAAPFGDIGKAQRVHQAFGYEYQLPNVTAYNETCAALGGVFWAQRMFAIEPSAEAFDLIERIVYNLASGAVSLDGQRYFYENMLRRTRKVPYFLMWPRERTDTFHSFCCPTNLSRFFMETGDLAYAQQGQRLYAGLYGESEAEVRLAEGPAFTVRQQTDYPWRGQVRFTFHGESIRPFTLMLRIPQWCSAGCVHTPSGATPLTPALSGCYLPVSLSEPASSEVLLEMDISPRLTVAHPMVEENEGCVCVERGPLVYCVESADQPEEALDGLCLDGGAPLTEEEGDIAGERVIVLSTPGLQRSLGCGAGLYRRWVQDAPQRQTIRLIPYYAWNNRGFGEMRVWLPLAVRA